MPDYSDQLGSNLLPQQDYLRAILATLLRIEARLPADLAPTAKPPASTRRRARKPKPTPSE